MNWYKYSKNLQDIVWDPNPETKEDNYVVQHVKSDMKAIMEEIYQHTSDKSKLAIGDEFESALTRLSGRGGDDSMWNYFITHREKDSHSEQGQYVDKMKEKVKDEYKNFYKERKKSAEGVVADPTPQGGGSPDMGEMPPMM
jgi:hypothetical protein